MNKFNEYNLKISEKNKKLISHYLNNISKYIEQNELDNELFFDIEERVFEKLSNLEKIDQLNIKQILNQIGEPRDIFELEENEFKSTNKFLILLINFKKSFIKFISKIFATGFNLTNFITFIKIIIINFFKFSKKTIIKTFKIIKKIFIKFYFILLESVKFCYKNGILIIKKIFNSIGCVIGYIILLTAILLLFIVPILFYGIEVGNINYTEIIPDKLIFSYLFFLISIFILGIFFIIRKRFLILFILFSGFIVLSGSLGFLGFIEVYNNHSYIGKIEETHTLKTNNQDLILSSYDINLYGNLYIDKELYNDFSTSIKKSDDNNFKIKVITEVYTSTKQKFKEIEKKLNTFEFLEKDKYITLDLENKQIFTEKSKFIPIDRGIELYIPEGKTVKFDYTYFGYFNVNLGECSSRIFGILDGKVSCIEENKILELKDGKIVE